MLSIAYPWLALLLPAPLLVYWLLPAHATRRPAVRVPFFATLARLSGAPARAGAGISRRGPWRRTALLLCWLLVLAALMPPQWVLPPCIRIGRRATCCCCWSISPPPWTRRTSPTRPATR
ncbi:hypothetical protein [Ancylobacter sp. 3268]|uniref:hypothetical protein n=1 Tax=Ancylobacter sp. 3268 TaxID=2817752 RepID=UPI00286AD6F3|nr:hypothetical protein [Ancylobacter sp. 3268]